MPPPHRPKPCPKTRPETSAVLPRNPETFVTNAWFSGHVSGRPLCPTCTFGCVVHKRLPCPPQAPPCKCAQGTAKCKGQQLAPAHGCLFGQRAPHKGPKAPRNHTFRHETHQFLQHFATKHFVVRGHFVCVFDQKLARFKTVVRRQSSMPLLP